ncbi:hypothetical protein N7481_001570 [Penicillium waksmanii]|uniref:uncharacterized protein n=1 Tax=Penicillium waksmanii TaxID=69791 RepID=UPI0025490C5E|nr:uncharacterized protein N7481_001570 [Penicillium waksmanii]KAJ6001161.1 hypothetical protein N7481_001570 [Penicillium waksmanii]
MECPKFEPRLLTHVLEQEAAKSPDRLFCIHPLSLKRLSEGWRRITIGDLNNAVNNFAWWIERSVAPKNRSRSTRLIYIGPNDIRYAIFVLACWKLDHCAMLLAPSTSKSVTEYLLKSGDCSNLLFSSEYHQKIQEIREGFKLLQVWEVMELWSLFDKPAVAFPTGYREYHLAKEREPAIVLHSSGTTGLPKEIVFPHGYFTAVDFYRHILVPTGRVSTLPWPIDPKVPLFLKTNLFHGTGLVVWAAAIFNGTHFVLGPDAPLTGAVLKGILSDTGATMGLFISDTLASLGSCPEGIEALSGLTYTAFVGMPLSANIGHILSRVTRLYSCFGLTETCCISALQPKEPADWEYFEWNPNHPIEMRKHGEYHQLVIPRPLGRYTHCVFHVLPSISEFCTGDLFLRHPKDEMLWKHVGREDDMTKLQNRVLLYPGPIELALEGHRFVHKTIITTNKALRAVLIVEPNWEQVGHVRLPEGLVESIWPLVQKINNDLPCEAEISRGHILVATKDHPFQTTAKGTVKRRLVVQSYWEKIESLPWD